MPPPRWAATRLAALQLHTPPLRPSPTPAVRTPSSRDYYSYEHPLAAGPFSDTELAILAAAYKHVPEHGFSQKALASGARDAGYLDISAGLLPDGTFSLVRYHLVTQREVLGPRSKEIFAQDDGVKLPVADKLERLTWERLQGNRRVIGKWQEALAIMIYPTYVPASLKELAMLADELWFLAGDTSVDPTWYAKRAALSTIYASTELFMTNDKSSDFRETREFLGRRLEEAHQAAGTLSSLGQWVGFTTRAGINVLRSKGVRI